MGNCGAHGSASLGSSSSSSSSAVASERLIVDSGQKNVNKSIEERLMQDMEEEKKVIKCLLLGAGECGKSTILKQMKILHKDGFSGSDREYFKPLIYKNTLEAIQTLCSACNTLSIAFDSPHARARGDYLLSLPLTDVPLTILPDLLLLWSDSGVQSAYTRSNEFQLLDSTSYFLDPVNLRRIFSSDYSPSEQDILRSRVSTTGIIQTDFKIDKLTFKMFDVGGQRGERKKWIHCFDNVTAIMFIASLNEYDQVLAEDRTRNRLKESLDLFEGIINLPWFKEAPIILFLNKDDLFRRKIMTVDIGIYFPQYQLGLVYQSGLQFIQDAYFERNDNPLKTIYCHVTNATNTDNIAFVWKCTKHIILEQNLTKSGLLMV